MKERIRFLRPTFGNDAGETARIAQETGGEVYYYDGFQRYCFLSKAEEGQAFERVRPKRANSAGNKVAT